MAVKEKKPTFVASDGAKFATKIEAERHEALTKAKRDFEQAKKRLNAALVESQKTADGQLFDVGRWADYWFVSEFGNEGPQLVRVPFGYGVEFALSDYRYKPGSQLELIVIDGRHSSSGARFIHYKVSELYADEKNARLALATVVDKFIQRKREEVKKLRGDKCPTA
jgi:hypothetical protein